MGFFFFSYRERTGKRKEDPIPQALYPEKNLPTENKIDTDMYRQCTSYLLLCNKLTQTGLKQHSFCESGKWV